MARSARCAVSTTKAAGIRTAASTSSTPPSDRCGDRRAQVAEIRDGHGRFGGHDRCGGRYFHGVGPRRGSGIFGRAAAAEWPGAGQPDPGHARRDAADAGPDRGTAAPASTAPANQQGPVHRSGFARRQAGTHAACADGVFLANIDKYPDSTLAPNAYYWLGSSYQVTQNYKPALTAFETLLRKYPGDPKAAEAQLRVADCQVALKDFSAARTTLQAVIKAHPGTSLEKRARNRMSDIPPSPAKS